MLYTHVFSAVADDAVRIGAIASLTGPAAEQGKNWIRGAELAVSDLSREGIHVDLSVEDDQTTPAKAASAFQVLASVKKTRAIIGGTWDFLAEAVYPLAAQFRVPFVTPTNPPEIFSDKVRTNPFVFSNSFSLESEATELRRILIAAHARSIALIFVNVPFGERHGALMRGLANELGIHIAFEQSVEIALENSELKVAALRVQKEKPEVVFIVKDYAGLDAFMTELERVHARPLVLTTQHLDEAFALSKDESKYKRVYGLYPSYRREPFTSAFREKYGSEPKVYAESGYDALQFLARALHAGIQLEDQHSKFCYSGLTGEYCVPAFNKSLVQAPVEIMAIREGKLQAVTALETDLKAALLDE